MRLPTRALVVTSLLASSLSAQLGTVQPSCRGIGKNVPAFETGAFTRTHALELNRDDRADVALLAGETALVAFSPGIYEAVKALPGSALDFVALPGAGIEGADALVVTSARPALEKWSLDLDSATFTMTPLAHSGWAGVRELAAADLDGDGALDVCGITSNGQSVIRLSAGSALPSFTTLGETLSRLTPIEWDGTAGSELALLTSWGIRVIEPSGAPLFSVATYGGASDRFAAADSALPYQRLSTVVRMPDSTRQLFTADRADWDALTFLGNLAPAAMVSGQLGGDELGDVCISHTTSAQLVLFESQLASGPQSFDWTSGAYTLWDPTSDGSGSAPAPENQAHPTLVDLDQDGDGDVAFPLQKERVLVTMRNRARDHIRLAPSVESALYVYSHPTQSGTLHLTLAAPLEPPREDDAVRLVVWRQQSLSHYYDVDPQAVHSAVHGVAEWPLTVAIPLVEPLESPALFHVELRMAELDGAEVESCGATAVWTFTTSEWSKDLMISEYDVPEAAILVVPVDEQDSGEQQLVFGGGWTGPMPCIPCFSEDDIPDPGN